MLMKKIAFITKECVACGSCLKLCPVGAITIHNGCFALVDENKCIGCGKCVKACPAGVIEICTREDKVEKIDATQPIAPTGFGPSVERNGYRDEKETLV